VLQQSAVLENDQFSSPAKQRALLTLVLDVHDRLVALLDRGVALTDLEAVDLSTVLRARYDTAPDDAEEVERIGRDLMHALDEIG